MSAALMSIDVPTRYSVRLDTDLIETDDLLKRWAKGSRIASTPIHPLERMRMLRDGTVFSQPAPTQKEIFICDEVVTQSPQDVKTFIVLWYCDGRPVSLKALHLGLHRSTMYTHLGKKLSYIRGQLNARGVKV